MRLPAEAIERILERWPVGRLGTRDASGGVHLVPVVFVRCAGDLWSPVDGKPKSTVELARVRDLRRDPRATLLLDEYQEEWARLWWIRLELRAEVIDAPDGQRDPEVTRVLSALCEKYPQYRRVPVLAQGAPLLRFRVEGAISWCADASLHR